MRSIVAAIALVLCAACASPRVGMPPAASRALPGGAVTLPGTSDGARRELVSRLDSLARAAVVEGPLASVSVAVIRGRDTLLLAAHGHAELGLGVAATPATRYRMAGTPFLAAAVLRAAEQGLLSLEDEAAAHLPEFPWQGRRVTIRQLLDSTSGLQDYHYLGDETARAFRMPMRTEELAALVASRPFVHEPGATWSWTISGRLLAGMILERVTGTPYPEWVRREVLAPGGLLGFTYCDDAVTPGLAHGYALAGAAFTTDVANTHTFTRFGNFCGSALDASALPAALHGILAPSSLEALLVPRGAAARSHAPDTLSGDGLDVIVSHEEGRRWWGGYGTTGGYGSSWLHFPDDSLTVVVLANTLLPVPRTARNLGRAVLGLPLLPAPAPPAPLVSLPTTAEERRGLVGQYRLTRTRPSTSYGAWRATLCVYEEGGRLMGQLAGVTPRPMLKQEDAAFVLPGLPGVRIRFRSEDGRVVGADGEVAAAGRVTAIRESPWCSGGLAPAGAR